MPAMQHGLHFWEPDRIEGPGCRLNIKSSTGFGQRGIAKPHGHERLRFLFTDDAACVLYSKSLAISLPEVHWKKSWKQLSFWLQINIWPAGLTYWNSQTKVSMLFSELIIITISYNFS